MKDIEKGAEQMYRMDFIREPVLEPQIVDGEIESLAFKTRYRPHPDRYERRDNPPGWFDKFEKTVIPDEELENMPTALDDVPHYHDPPKIDDTSKYISARLEEMRLVLSQDVPIKMIEPDKSKLSDFYEQNNPGFIIISIDLVGSTNLMTQMESGRFTLMLQLYLKEVSQLLHHFHASILSVQADGIMAFLSGPNLTGMHDNAVDCAASIRQLMEEGINKVLKSHGYPTIKYRIGLNTGSAEIIPQGENDYNLIGTAVSLASKIQEAANSDEILLGEITERNLHTRWRKNTTKVTNDRNWNYKISGELYDIYKYESNNRLGSDHGE